MEQRDYIIRRAATSDAEALAKVREAAWRETYAGLQWGRVRHALGDEAGQLTTTYVAERADGQLAAFASCGAQRDPQFAEAGYAGEFTAVYVLKADQRRGLGTKLMKAMIAELTERGLAGFTLWVPRENIPFRSLTEQLGGKLLGQREVAPEPEALVEVAYGWEGTA